MDVWNGIRMRKFVCLVNIDLICTINVNLMPIKLFLLTALLFQFPFIATAASECLEMRHLDTTTSLSNTRINSICKDSSGFLWIGTSSGLCRYDGYAVQMYRESHPEDTSVLGNFVEEIQEDGERRLWILAEGDYRLYSPDTEEVVEDITPYLRERGITGDVANVLAASDGVVWIAVAGGMLYALPPGEGKAVAVEGAMTGGDVTDMVESGPEIICVTGDGSLVFVDAMRRRVTHTERGVSPYGLHGSDTRYAAYADNDHRVWLFCNDIINAYDVAGKRWLSDRMPPKSMVGVVKNIFQDHEGHLWIARDHKGIARIVDTPEGFRVVESEGLGELRENSTVTCLTEDSDGTLWIGTFKQGLYSFNDAVTKFRMESIPDVNCMVLADSGHMWVGTDASGIWLWDFRSGEKTRIPDSSEGDTPAAVTCMATAPDGTLYVGSFSKGLRKYKGGRFSRVHTGTGLDEAFPWSLTFDTSGNLWVGTLGSGLYEIDGATGSTRQFRESGGGLSSDYVMSGIQSRNGKMYFGTSYGISEYDPASGKLSRYLDDGWTAIPSRRNITQIYEDSRGLMWVATQGGLKVIDRKCGKVHDIVLRDGRTHFCVLGVVEDNGGAMWVAEGANLIHLKVSYNDRDGAFSVEPRVYDSNDGVQGCELNQRSFARLPDGEIAVGGLYGINRIYPYDIKFNTSHPKVMFTDLLMGNHRVRVGEEIDGRVVLDRGLNQGARLEFNHNPEEFTVYFASDNYALPGNAVFRYKLEGFNDEWLSCPRGVNHITYTNLSPGTYRLLVKAVNSDGFESEEAAELAIHVNSPLWATPWAYALYLAIAVVSVYLIVRFVRGRERKVFEQKRKDDAIRKQEELNQMKFKFFTNVSHDLRTPLTLIVSPLEAMLKEARDEKETRRLTLMRNNAMRLLALVNQLLDFRKTEMAGLQLNASEGDVVAFARGVCSSFLTLSERKGINLTFYSDRERIELSFDSDKMEKILMNLLGNAFKFTPPGGRVDVALECVGEGGETLRIKVADNGPGISDKDKPHIFERFYQVDDNGNAHPGMGSGIGLSMVSEYVRLHEGSVRVADNVEGGSVFIVEIPVRHVAVHAVNKEPDVAQEGAGAATECDGNASGRTPEDNDGARPLALVVDDNPDISELVSDGVGDEFEVVTASDGEEAMVRIAERKPSIVIADLMMPKMDGIELCRRLKSEKETAGIPVIILTAKHDLGAKVEGLTLGADDYMTKPFNLDVLRLRMRKLVQLTSKGATRGLIEPEPEKIEITPLDEKFIEKAVNYVSENLDRSELSVEEMSESLGMSRVRLYKKIKQITGKTPIEFIRVIRLKRAAQLLRESQMNVSEIAYQTGFNSPKVFSKYFREEFGVLPSVYQGREGKETSYTI